MILLLLIENDKELRFIITVSSARKLKRDGANLLGGRAMLYARNNETLLCEAA